MELEVSYSPKEATELAAAIGPHACRGSVSLDEHCHGRTGRRFPSLRRAHITSPLADMTGGSGLS
jgi:hypothetical protein